MINKLKNYGIILAVILLAISFRKEIQETVPELFDWISKMSTIEQEKPETLPEPTKQISKRYTEEEIINILKSKAKQYNVRYEFAYCVAKVESNLEQTRSRHEPDYQAKYFKTLKFPIEWKNELKDKAGQDRACTSHGIMQLMPHTAYIVSKKLGIVINQISDLFDVDLNVELGVAYLKYCILRNPRDITQIAICYNGSATYADKIKDCIINELLFLN